MPSTSKMHFRPPIPVDSVSISRDPTLHASVARPFRIRNIFVSDVKFDAVDPPEAIEQYVRQGGNAIVWLGPNVDKDRYEKTWRSSNRDEIFLPFTLDKIESMNDRALDPLGYQSPVILPFRDHPESGLLTTPIEKFWQFRLDPTPSTVTHFSNQFWRT